MQRKKRIKQASLLLLGFVLLAGGSMYAGSNPLSSVEAASVPSSMPATAQSGEAVYKQHCLSCHATDGAGGGKYPAVASDQVKTKLGSIEKAYDYISRMMPNNAPGSLSEDEYKAVAKYILSLNGIPTDFSDIQKHWAEKEIVALHNKKYIDGYTDSKAGTMQFKPDQFITRAEFVRYLVKAKELFLSNQTESEFKDIGTNKEDRVYIITAVEYGLINGYPDQTFRPDNTITRSEIAAILSRSEILKASIDASFKDVPADYWAGEAIRAVQEAGLFNGYEDGTFRPDQKMTRAEAVSVIYRLVNQPQT